MSDLMSEVLSVALQEADKSEGLAIMEELIPKSKPLNNDGESEADSDKIENSEESSEDKTVIEEKDNDDDDNDDDDDDSFTNKIDEFNDSDEDIVLKENDKRQSLAWDSGAIGPPNFAASTPLPGGSAPVTSTPVSSSTPGGGGTKPATVAMNVVSTAFGGKKGGQSLRGKTLIKSGAAAAAKAKEKAKRVSNKDSWLLWTLKQVCDTFVLGWSDDNETLTVCKSKLPMNTDDIWRDFMNDSYMQETLLIAQDLNVRAPVALLHSVESFTFIVNVLNAYETTEFEAAECGYATTGNSEESTKRRIVLQNIGCTFLLGNVIEREEDLQTFLVAPIDKDLFKMLLSRLFDNMQELMTVLVHQKRTKGKIQRQYQALTLERSDLYRELEDNGHTVASLRQLKLKIGEFVNRYEDSIEDLMIELLSGWEEKVTLDISKFLFTLLLYTDVECVDPTDPTDMSKCPVISGGEANNQGMVNYHSTNGDLVNYIATISENLQALCDELQGKLVGLMELEINNTGFNTHEVLQISTNHGWMSPAHSGIQSPDPVVDPPQVATVDVTQTINQDPLPGVNPISPGQIQGGQGPLATGGQTQPGQQAGHGQGAGGQSQAALSSGPGGLPPAGRGRGQGVGGQTPAAQSPGPGSQPPPGQGRGQGAGGQPPAAQSPGPGGQPPSGRGRGQGLPGSVPPGPVPLPQGPGQGSGQGPRGPGQPPPPGPGLRPQPPFRSGSPGLRPIHQPGRRVGFRDDLSRIDDVAALSDRRNATYVARGHNEERGDNINPTSNEGIKISNLTCNLKRDVGECNKLLESLPTAEAIRGIRNNNELINYNATLAGVELFVKTVTSTASELSKLGARAPIVPMADTGSGPETVSGASWSSRTQILTTALKLSLEQQKKNNDLAVNASSHELIKTFSKLVMPKLESSKNALAWLAKLYNYIGSDDQVLTAASHAPGFTQMLLDCLSGTDLSEAKHKNSAAEIIQQLRTAYIEHGLGVNLLFKRTLLVLPKPGDQSTASFRDKTILSNCNFTYESLQSIYDTGVVEQVDADTIQKLMKRIFDMDHFKRWNTRLRIFKSSSEAEKAAMLRVDMFDLNDSTYTVTPTGACGTQNMSFMSRDPAYVGQRTHVTIPAMTEYTRDVTAREMFGLATIFIHTVRHNLTYIRHEDVKSEDSRSNYNNSNNVNNKGFSSNNVEEKPNNNESGGGEHLSVNLTVSKKNARFPCFLPECQNKEECPGLPQPSLYFCVTYRALDVEIRYKKAIDLKLCVRCLQKEHTGDCKSNVVCRKKGCESPHTHNTLLHEMFANKESVNNMIEQITTRMDELDGSNISQDLYDQFDQVNQVNHVVNMTGELLSNYPYVVNATKRDPVAWSQLLELVANALPPKHSLPMDTWTPADRLEYKAAVHDLDFAVAGAKAAQNPRPPGSGAPPPDTGAGAGATVNNLAEHSNLLNVASVLQQVTIHTFEPPSDNLLTRPDSSINNIEAQSRGGHLDRDSLRELAASAVEKTLSTFFSCTNTNKDNIPDDSLCNIFSTDQLLYDKLLEIQTRLFSICNTKNLNYIRTELVIKEPTQKSLDAIKELEDTFLHFEDGEWKLRVTALADNGSNISLGLDTLIDAIDPPKIREFNTSISTVAGSTNSKPDFKYKLRIRAGQLDFYGSFVRIPAISPERQFSAAELAVIEATFGLLKHNWQNISLPLQQSKAYLLVSNDQPELTMTPVSDPRVIGWEYNIFSPNLVMNYVPWASGSGPKFIVSGSFGVDPGLIQRESGYPRLVAPTEEIKKCHRRADEFIPRLKNTQALILGSYLANMKIDMIDSEQLHVNHLSQVEDTQAITQLKKTDTENMFHESVNMTLDDSKRISDFLAREAALINPVILCPAHDRLDRQTTLNSCELCKLKNTNVTDRLHEERFLHLWHQVVLEDEDEVLVKGGKSRILVKNTFNKPLYLIGKLENSNLKAAERSSLLLFRRAKELGALSVINDQFRDKIAAGHLEILPAETIRKIIKGELYHQCVSRNFVYNLSSKTTPLRLITNTQNKIPRSQGESLVTADPCPAWLTSQLLDISIRSFTINCLGQGDLSKAYLSLNKDDQGSLMFINWWYLLDPKCENPDTEFPLLLASKCVDFGFSSASALLSISIKKYGTKVVTLQVSKDTLDQSVYIDNINLDHNTTVSGLADTIVDMKTNLGRIGLNLDKLYLPKYLYDHPDMAPVRALFDFKPETVTLGQRWDLVTDQMTPNTSLSLHGSHRGMPTGAKLTEEELMNTKLTRAHLQRLAPSLWCNTGRFLGPVVASAKLLLSLTCKVMSASEMEKPIEENDKELALTCHKFWSNVVNTAIRPTPRCCIKEGFKLVHVIVDGDASHQLFAAVLILVSENAHGARETSTLLCKSVISYDSVPSNESRAKAVAISLLLTFVNAIKPVMKEHDIKFDVTVAFDNLASSYLFKRETKNVLTRNVRAGVMRDLVTISIAIPDITVTLVWLPGFLLSSDAASKLFINAVDVANSKVWREGNDEYKNYESLQHFWFLRHSKGLTTYRSLPAIAANASKNFADIVDSNPMPDDLYEIIFDEHDNVISEKKVNNSEDIHDSASVNMTVSDTMDLEMDIIHDYSDEPYATYENDLLVCDASFKYFFPYCNNVDLTPEKPTQLPLSVKTISRSVFETRVRSIPTVSRSDFETRSQMEMQNNLLAGYCGGAIIAKDMYDSLMLRSNNVISIVNTVIICKGFLKPKSYRSNPDLVRETWASLVKSDQLHYPVDTTSSKVDTVNEIKVVVLRLHGITLPILSQYGPLLRKMVLTLHVSCDNNEMYTCTHVPAATLRQRLLSGQFGVYTFQLDKVLSAVIGNCGRCLRTTLRQFQFRAGNRMSRVDPDSGLWKRVSIDPIGVFCMRQYDGARKSTLSVYLLICADYSTGGIIIQPIGSLKAASVILGIRTIEKRLCASIQWIHVDKGSSLTPALLESPQRDWRIIQAPATHHSSLLVEGRIKHVRKFFNTFHGKFSKEVKSATPLHIFQFLMLAANIEYQINSTPYSKTNQLSPSHLIHARGIEHERSHWELIEAADGDKSLSCLKPYLETLEKIRVEMMAEALCLPASLYETQDSKLYLPKTGSVVLALLGSGNSAELAVVTKGTDKAENDKPNDDPVSQNEDVSERKVLIRNKLGHERVYPVQSLCPLSDPVDPLEWTPKSSCSLTGLTGKWAVMIHDTIFDANFFSWKTQEEMMTQDIDCQQIFFIFIFHRNKFNIKTFRSCVILSIACMISSWNATFPACTSRLCQVISFSNNPHSVKSCRTSPTFSVLSVTRPVCDHRMRGPLLTAVSLSVMMNWIECKPVARAEADPSPFFLVRLHPEEQLTSNSHTNVSHMTTNTFLIHSLSTSYVKDVSFNSDAYHTDGSPGDYVYQKVSEICPFIKILVHVSCTPLTPVSGLMRFTRSRFVISNLTSRKPLPLTGGSLRPWSSRSLLLLLAGPSGTSASSPAARPSTATTRGRRLFAWKWQMPDYPLHSTLSTPCSTLDTPHTHATDSWISYYLPWRLIFNQNIYSYDFVCAIAMFYCKLFLGPASREINGQNLEEPPAYVHYGRFFTNSAPPPPDWKIRSPSFCQSRNLDLRPLFLSFSPTLKADSQNSLNLN